MSNKPSRPRARSAATKGAPIPTPAPKRNLLWLWVGLAVIVLIAGIVAIVSGGDDKELSVGTVPTAVDGSNPPGAADGESKGEVWPVTVTGTALPQFPLDGGDDTAVGLTAPTLTGFFFDGTPVSYDVSKGPVMLVFVAHWCPHCNREVPRLLQWKASGAVPADLQVMAVTTGVDPNRTNYPPSSWIKNIGWDWPVIADSQTQDAAIAMGLTSYPFVVIIGTDGKVLTRWAGEKGADGIQELVDAALA